MSPFNYWPGYVKSEIIAGQYCPHTNMIHALCFLSQQRGLLHQYLNRPQCDPRTAAYVLNIGQCFPTLFLEVCCAVRVCFNTNKAHLPTARDLLERLFIRCATFGLKWRPAGWQIPRNRAGKRWCRVSDICTFSSEQLILKLITSPAARLKDDLWRVHIEAVSQENKQLRTGEFLTW